tara:strand:- start:306 stop:536 length:231 start_codon:yes stop_codon:yes gene_type:complete
MIGAWRDSKRYPFALYGVPYTAERIEEGKYTVGVRQTAYDVLELVSFDMSSIEGRTAQVHALYAEFTENHLIVGQW